MKNKKLIIIVVSVFLALIIALAAALFIVEKNSSEGILSGNTSSKDNDENKDDSKDKENEPNARLKENKDYIVCVKENSVIYYNFKTEQTITLTDNFLGDIKKVEPDDNEDTEDNEEKLVSLDEHRANLYVLNAGLPNTAYSNLLRYRSTSDGEKFFVASNITGSVSFDYERTQLFGSNLHYDLYFKNIKDTSSSPKLLEKDVELFGFIQGEKKLLVKKSDGIVVYDTSTLKKEKEILFTEIVDDEYNGSYVYYCAEDLSYIVFGAGEKVYFCKDGKLELSQEFYEIFSIDSETGTIVFMDDDNKLCIKKRESNKIEVLSDDFDDDSELFYMNSQIINNSTYYLKMERSPGKISDYAGFTGRLYYFDGDKLTVIADNVISVEKVYIDGKGYVAVALVLDDKKIKNFNFKNTDEDTDEEFFNQVGKSIVFVDGKNIGSFDGFEAAINRDSIIFADDFESTSFQSYNTYYKYRDFSKERADTNVFEVKYSKRKLSKPKKIDTCKQLIKTSGYIEDTAYLKNVGLGQEKDKHAPYELIINGKHIGYTTGYSYYKDINDNLYYSVANYYSKLGYFDLYKNDGKKEALVGESVVNYTILKDGSIVYLKAIDDSNDIDYQLYIYKNGESNLLDYDVDMLLLDDADYFRFNNFNFGARYFY